jgi:putative SOS response-associated peptidase YedK
MPCLWKLLCGTQSWGKGAVCTAFRMIVGLMILSGEPCPRSCDGKDSGVRPHKASTLSIGAKKCYTLRIMCGRYSLSIAMADLEERFQAVGSHELPVPTYNAAPSQTLPVILNANPREITRSVWGFIPEWADGRAGVKPLINARAETVATKPTFRTAFKNKRCLILADGFYEWKRAGKGKIPYRMALTSQEPFAFAGLWSTVHDPTGQPYTTFTILTTAANDRVAEIHHRMPVILQARDEADWLNQHSSLEAAQGLLLPFPADLMTVYEVSTRVNSPAYNTPDALQPVSPTPRSSGNK